MKRGTEPAFPCLKPNASGYGDALEIIIKENINYIPFTKGMSVRLKIASDTMCALINGNISNNTNVSRRDIIHASLLYTDELLKQEEETRNNE